MDGLFWRCDTFISEGESSVKFWMEIVEELDSVKICLVESSFVFHFFLAMGAE